MKLRILIVMVLIALIYFFYPDNLTSYTTAKIPEQIVEPEPIVAIPEASNNSLLIATFNIQTFGRKKIENETVSMMLADIVDNYDLVGVQEIRDNTEETGSVFLSLIQEESPDFNAVFSERLGRTSSKEQYAFYYDSKKLKVLGRHQFDDPEDLFEREPFSVKFSRGDFDFFVMNVHIKPDDAVTEIEALTSVIQDAKEFFGDEDFIVLGDFNADCSYFDEDERQVLSYDWIIPEGFDTTVAESSCTYDNFVVSDSVRERVLAVDVDEFEEFNIKKEIESKISDHYPVSLLLK